ncbi:hypothetical protein K388_01948 [Streptomyces sp. KhCrAH-43]|nr:hypothetical protein K388_01948 [Streptomyces sp. KhCrAH-43]
MTAQKTKPKEPVGEAAYLAWIGHTTACAACRVGAPCVTAIRLGRAWRQARA